MNPSGVIKIDIALNAAPHLSQAAVVVQIYVFVFQRPPETLHFCVAQTTAFAVHADLYFELTLDVRFVFPTLHTHPWRQTTALRPC